MSGSGFGTGWAQGLEFVVPSPSAPVLLSPQHQLSSCPPMMQVCSPPACMETTVSGEADGAFGGGPQAIEAGVSWILDELGKTAVLPQQ